MGMSIGGAISALGFAVLIHTTFNVIKHRELLKILQEDVDTLPTTIIAELIAGLLLAAAGAFLLTGSLKPVILTSHSGAVDQGSYRMDFLSFNTRAKAFHFQPT